MGASRGAARLRQKLKQGGLIRGISCYDPMTARMAEAAGFDLVAVSGSLIGASRATPEPVLTMNDMVDAARAFCMATDLPVKLDCGAGFGDPIHVVRTVREAEAAGVACYSIEDQLYPKRAHYHLGVEKVIPAEEMVEKIKAAVETRRDPDLMIIGRTDAIKTAGLGEAIRRANLYAKAGCEMIMFFPESEDDLRVAVREISAPLAISCAPGVALYKKRGSFYSFKELEDLGYRLAIDSKSVTIAATLAVREMLAEYAQTGKPPASYFADAQQIRTYINELAGLDPLYALERATTEK